MEILTIVAYLAVIYVFIVGLASSAVHMFRAGLRLLREHPANLNWLVAGRWIVVLAVASWLLLVLIIHWVDMAIGLSQSTVDRVARSLFFFGLLPVIILPVLLPLAEVASKHRTSSMTLAIAAVIAFPAITALALSYSYDSMTRDLSFSKLENGVQISSIANDLPSDADLYSIRKTDAGISPQRLALSERIAKGLGLTSLALGTNDSASIPESVFEQHRTALWLEMALNVITFEAIDKFNLNFSGLELNSKKGLSVPLVQFLFEKIYPLAFWSVVLLLIRSFYFWVRRHISGLEAAAAA